MGYKFSFSNAWLATVVAVATAVATQVPDLPQSVKTVLAVVIAAGAALTSKAAG